MHKLKTESQGFMLYVLWNTLHNSGLFYFSDFQLLLWLLSILTEMV